MAENKQKKIALDLRSLAARLCRFALRRTGGTQEAELNDEQLDEISGGTGIALFKRTIKD